MCLLLLRDGCVGVCKGQRGLNLGVPHVVKGVGHWRYMGFARSDTKKGLATDCRRIDQLAMGREGAHSTTLKLQITKPKRTIQLPEPRFSCGCFSVAFNSGADPAGNRRCRSQQRFRQNAARPSKRVEPLHLEF